MHLQRPAMQFDQASRNRQPQTGAVVFPVVTVFDLLERPQDALHVVWRDTDAGAPIDAKATMSRGETIDGPVGLREYLLSRQDEFLRTVTEKLLVYGLGRGLEYYDAPTVRHLVRNAADEDYRWSSLILGIVESVPFQMRRTTP